MTATSTMTHSPDHERPTLAGRHVHFCGIGGCGMSGLARLARNLGAHCTGSDIGTSATVEALQRDGFDVASQQSVASLPSDADLLVVSAAIKGDHPEVLAAQARGVEIVKYAQLLGRLMIGKTGLAIAGTHGKSSTTSMLTHVLQCAGRDPNFIVGAHCAQIGGGWGASKIGSDLLVAEACEFDRSFHNFHPRLAVILNIEEDHLDVYKDLSEIVEAFRVFAQRLPSREQGGFLLINHEMPHRLPVTAGLDCDVQTIGFAYQADWRVGIKNGHARLHHQGQAVMEWTNPLAGDHMAYNAGVAAVLAHRVGVAWDVISRALSSFQGLDRRMQRLGSRQLPGAGGWVNVVDDYGHHPTEIDTTLRALRSRLNPRRLLCVFQPHQHSRTRFLMEQFAASFDTADVVIVPDIYFVRDSQAERHAVSAADLVDRLRKRGKQAMHLYPFEAIVEQLQLIARDGDLLVTMGAGDVWKVARDFLST